MNPRMRGITGWCHRFATNRRSLRRKESKVTTRLRALSMASVFDDCACTGGCRHSAQAQTFTVLHNFTGGADGSISRQLWFGTLSITSMAPPSMLVALTNAALSTSVGWSSSWIGPAGKPFSTASQEPGWGKSRCRLDPGQRGQSIRHYRRGRRFWLGTEFMAMRWARRLSFYSFTEEYPRRRLRSRGRPWQYVPSKACPSTKLLFPRTTFSSVTHYSCLTAKRCHIHLNSAVGLVWVPEILACGSRSAGMVGSGRQGIFEVEMTCSSRGSIDLDKAPRLEDTIEDGRSHVLVVAALAPRAEPRAIHLTTLLPVICNGRAFSVRFQQNDNA
jgi:hypothetical protein